MSGILVSDGTSFRDFFGTFLVAGTFPLVDSAATTTVDWAVVNKWPHKK